MREDILLKTFDPPLCGDDEKQLAYVGKMRMVLNGIRDHPDMPAERIRRFAESLLERQGGDGDWPVRAEPMEPADFFDYALFPTIIATGIICRSLPFLSGAERIPYKEAMNCGFAYLAESRLEGVGEDTFFQQIESVFLLDEGGCVEYLEKNLQDRSAEPLVALLRGLCDRWSRRIEENRTALAYGGEYREILLRARGILNRLSK